jgi:hypothetical protein
MWVTNANTVSDFLSGEIVLSLDNNNKNIFIILMMILLAETKTYC